MACNCIDRVEAMLRPRNTRIKLPVMLGKDQTERAMIVTEQIEEGRGKEKATGVFATYCPFCGEPYTLENPEAVKVN